MTRIEDCLHQCKLLLVGARITACTFAESISVQLLRDLGHQALYDHEKNTVSIHRIKKDSRCKKDVHLP